MEDDSKVLIDKKYLDILHSERDMYLEIVRRANLDLGTEEMNKRIEKSLEFPPEPPEDPRECFCDMCDRDLTGRGPSSTLDQQDYFEHYYWHERVLCRECTIKLFEIVDVLYKLNKDKIDFIDNSDEEEEEE